MPTNLGSESYAPEFSSGTHSAALPTVDVRKPFILAAHPSRWGVIKGKLVPQLRTIPLANGVERVQVDPSGRVYLADTRAKLVQGGWIEIPLSAAPDGSSYMRRIETRQGTKVVPTFISVWETAYAGLPSTSVDLDGYADWLESLVTRGLVPPCSKHLAAEMLKASERRLIEAEQRMSDAPGMKRRVDALKIEVAVLQEHAEAGVSAQPIRSSQPGLLDELDEVS